MRALALIALLLGAGPAQAEPERIVALGGAVTEIVVALGAQDRLVGRDTTSTYPPSVTDLPDVGYVRALSPEGVLALGPDLILAEATAGPPEAIEVLRAAGVNYVALPETNSPDGVLEKFSVVGAALGRTAEAEALSADFRQDMDALHIKAQSVSKQRRVLFVLSIQGGRVMVGGEGSSAGAIIALAGGINAVSDLKGYKQITDEALLEAAPDVILMMDREGDLALTEVDIRAHPALGATPAAQAGAILRMDGMKLLGFGPRTPEAAADLLHALYPATGGQG
jgi:iron complex transport system substrate-binding protein